LEREKSSWKEKKSCRKYQKIETKITMWDFCMPREVSRKSPLPK